MMKCGRKLCAFGLALSLALCTAVPVGAAGPVTGGGDVMETVSAPEETLPTASESDADQEELTSGIEGSEAAEEVRALLDALPAEDEIEGMNEAERDAVCEQVEAARAAYEALSAGEKDLVPDAGDILAPLYMALFLPLKLDGKTLVEVSDQYFTVRDLLRTQKLKEDDGDPWGISLMTLGEEPQGDNYWISQLASLPSFPDYAVGLYEAMLEASDNDGADDWLIEDQYFKEEIYGFPFHKENLSVGRDDPAVKETILDVYGFAEDAVTAFRRDHPEVFWTTDKAAFFCRISGSSSGTSCNIEFVFATKYTGGNIGKFDIRGDGYRSEALIREGIARKDARIDELLAETDGAGPYKKICHFNQWLTHNNEYNTSGENCPEKAHSPITALLGGIGKDGPVCDSYAGAFKMLCDSAGILCITVTGNGRGGPHAWNYVNLYDRWYAVDVTWNDPTGGPTGTPVSGVEHEKYLLVGSGTKIGDSRFDETHELTDLLMLAPALSEDKYVYVTLENCRAILDKTDGVRYGDTLNVTLENAPAGRKLYYQWSVGEKKAGTDSPSYQVGPEAVGNVIRVTITADGCEGEASAETRTPVPPVSELTRLEKSLADAAGREKELYVSELQPSEIVKGVRYVDQASMDDLKAASGSAEAAKKNIAPPEELGRAAAGLEEAVGKTDAAVRVGTMETQPLKEALTEAKNAVNGIVVRGDRPSMVEKGVRYVAQDEMDAMKTALAKAETDLTGIRTAKEMEQAIAALKTAASRFTETIKTGTKSSGGSSSSGGGSGSGGGGSSGGGGGSGGSGGSGGGGGGSSSGGGPGGSSGNGPGSGQNPAAAASLPSYVVVGTWTQNAAGEWNFYDGSGLLYISRWGAVYNPYSSAEAFDWFRFDENGLMVTGWFWDPADQNYYYLNPVSDGTRGKMVTGWAVIDGKEYYFNPNSDGTRGRMLRNEATGDGHFVGADGTKVY